MAVKKNEAPRTDEALIQLGEDLRALRKAQNMTLSDLAGASGRSVSFLSKIERGLARPSVTALQEIAEALGVPEGTVKSRLYTARERLRRAMGVEKEKTR